MPGPHQVTTDVLAGPDQVPGRLLRQGRHPNRHDFVQTQQLREVHRVPGIGLDPITGRALQL